MMPGKKRIQFLMLTSTDRGKVQHFVVAFPCVQRLVEREGLNFWFLFTLYAMIKSQYMLIVFFNCKPYSNIYTFLKLHTCLSQIQIKIYNNTQCNILSI